MFIIREEFSITYLEKYPFVAITNFIESIVVKIEEYGRLSELIFYFIFSEQCNYYNSGKRSLKNIHKKTVGNYTEDDFFSGSRAVSAYTNANDKRALIETMALV